MEQRRFAEWLTAALWLAVLSALGVGLVVMFRDQAASRTDAPPVQTSGSLAQGTGSPPTPPTTVLTPPAATLTPWDVTPPPPTVRAATAAPTSEVAQITPFPSRTPLPTSSASVSPFSSQNVQFGPAVALNDKVVAAFGKAAWSPDSQMLAISAPTGRMLAGGGWPETDVTLLGADGQAAGNLVSGFDPIWSPDGKLIAYLEYCDTLNEGYIRIVDVTTKQATLVTTILRGGVFPILAWLSDTELLYYQDTVVLFDYQTGQKSNLLDLVTPPLSVATSRPLQIVVTNPKHNLVAVASWEVLVILERAVDGFRVLEQLEGVDNPALAFAPNGGALAYVSGPTQQLKIVSTRGNGPVIELPRASRSVPWTLSWSPDGASLVYADPDGVHLANRDGSGLRKLEGLPEGMFYLIWMPAGKALILSVSQADAAFAFFSLSVVNGR